MNRWITKNGKHIYIRGYGGSRNQHYYSRHSYDNEQKEIIQRELNKLKSRKESEIAEKAVTEGISFFIDHIIPMIGPIISTIIKLASLERENRETQEQIRLIDLIKKHVDSLFESGAKDQQQREEVVLIKRAYQNTFAKTTMPNKSRIFLREIITPKVINVVNSRFGTHPNYVMFYGSTALIEKANVADKVESSTTKIVDCLIEILSGRKDIPSNTVDLGMLSASLLQYCLEAQRASNSRSP